MNISRTIGAVVATTLLAFGCSSSTSSTSAGNGGTSTGPSGTTALDGGSSTATSTQALEVQMATAQCNFSQRCGPIEFTTSYTDLADCVSRGTKEYAKQLHAASTAGLETQVPACTAAIATTACDYAVPIAACAFKGTLATSAACSYASQCQSGSCFSATRTACGTCVEPVAVGADCTAASCESGSFCGSNKKCVAYPKENDACPSNGFCGSSLECSTAASPTCVKPVAKGGDCTNAGCGLDLDCVDNVCVDLTIAKMGEPCGYNENTGKTSSCLDGECLGLDANYENGKCGAWGQEGAACDVLKAACSKELTCVDGTCKYGLDLRTCN